MPRSPTAPRTLSVTGLALSCVLTAVVGGPARGQGPSARPKPAANPAAPAARARRVPEALNFANGLFRERRYELAAKEYERFLAEPASATAAEAAEARFGLANARLFQHEYAKARRGFEEFLRQSPDHPNAPTAWYRVGETSYMLGDLPAARRAFETYTADYPGHKHLETAWPYLGDVCLKAGDLPAARRAYEQSLAAHPGGRLADRARFGLGRALLLGKEPEAALRMFAAVAESGGRDWADRAWSQVGLVQAEARRYGAAAEAFAKVEELAPQSPLVPEARLNRAEALLKLGRRAEAEPVLKALAADAPENVGARASLALGAGQLDAGEAAEALATLDAAASRFAGTPTASALLFRSAEAAQRAGRPDEARARFLRAAEADPDDPWADDALLRAARLAYDRRDAADAAGLAETFAKRYPASPLRADARLIAARVALAAGRPKDAVAGLTAGLAGDDPAPAAARAMRLDLGRAYHDDGQSARAEETLTPLSQEADTPAAADALFLLGRYRVEAGSYAGAVDPLEKYLTSKPTGDVAAYALAYLVQARLALGESDEAGRSLDALAAGFPKSEALPVSRVRLAEWSLGAKQYGRAADQFRAAAAEATDPALASRSRLGLGWSLLDGGKPAEAAEAFAAAAAASAPGDPLAPEAALAEGRAWEAAGKAEPALTAYATAMRAHPGTAAAGLAAAARARLLAAEKRPAEAAEAFAALVGDAPAPAGQPPRPDAAATDALLADWGWALVDADKPAEADKVFERLLRDYPDGPYADDARFNLAESANQARRPDDVVRLLAPMVAEGSRASPRLVHSALYRLGRTQAEAGDWAGASRSLDRLLKDDPGGPLRREAALLRAEVALELNDPAAADALLAPLESGPAEPGDPEGFAPAVRRRRVQSLLGLRKWAEVLAAADAFAAASPGDLAAAEVGYARGRALQQLARWDEARAAFRAVIDGRAGGDLPARAQLMTGETYLHQKNYEEAVRQFMKVDVLYDAPRWQAAALLEAGKAYEGLARWADAADIYESLRAQSPKAAFAPDAADRARAARGHADDPR